MKNLTRREFIELGARISIMFGFGASFAPEIASALSELPSRKILWLQGQSCSGCSVSMLNSEDPGPAELLTKYIDLLFHSTISFASGHTGMKVIRHTIEKGGYFLVVEGSIPKKVPKACMVGGEPISTLLARAAGNAETLISLGTCATFGGIPAAKNNPTGAVGVPEFIKSLRIRTPIVSLPGCPAHPDWLVGTLIHLLRFGMPRLDEMKRPFMFYGRLVHDQCPRFADYEREHFATSFSEDGCLFKLGCLGPVTHADCNLRRWNGGTNSCIPAGGPCIGCAGETFAMDPGFPFYRKNEERHK